MNQSIDVLYDAFAAVPKPTAIDACSCCVDADEIATLLTNPLRDISPDELSVYASKVFLTVGAESDFRYFVPRIFEILATESGWWPDPEVVGRALARAGRAARHAGSRLQAGHPVARSPGSLTLGPRLELTRPAAPCPAHAGAGRSPGPPHRRADSGPATSASAARAGAAPGPGPPRPSAAPARNVAAPCPGRGRRRPGMPLASGGSPRRATM